MCRRSPCESSSRTRSRLRRWGTSVGRASASRTARPAAGRGGPRSRNEGCRRSSDRTRRSERHRTSRPPAGGRGHRRSRTSGQDDSGRHGSAPSPSPRGRPPSSSAGRSGRRRTSLRRPARIRPPARLSRAGRRHRQPCRTAGSRSARRRDPAYAQVLVGLLERSVAVVHQRGTGLAQAAVGPLDHPLPERAPGTPPHGRGDGCQASGGSVAHQHPECQEHKRLQHNRTAGRQRPCARQDARLDGAWRASPAGSTAPVVDVSRRSSRPLTNRPHASSSHGRSGAPVNGSDPASADSMSSAP